MTDKPILATLDATILDMLEWFHGDQLRDVEISGDEECIHVKTTLSEPIEKVMVTLSVGMDDD